MSIEASELLELFLWKGNEDDDPKFYKGKLYELEILSDQDSVEEQVFIIKLYSELLELFTRPFNVVNFDFSDETFFQENADLGQRYAKLSNIKRMDTNRGSKHFIYLNRTFFGLYNMMHDLKAQNIVINQYKNFKQ